MQRRKFIKGSAIVGASVAVPVAIQGLSGMNAQPASRKVHRILNASRTKVGTLPIIRAFAGDQLDYVSPFVLFDEFGPVHVEIGSAPLRVDAHPHAGVMPTTYFLAGSGHHKDSLQYDFQIEKGDFMIFNSGKGAIHMEESGRVLKESGGAYHGFQIWLNMPAAFKRDDPITRVFRNEDMNEIIHESYSIKVILGSLFDATSKIKLLSPAFYYHIKLSPDTRLDIPTDSEHNAFAYVIHGELELESQRRLRANQIALYERKESMINLYSKAGAELLILGGQPLNEEVYSYGPFVMNSSEEIQQCIADYQSGKMGDPSLVN